MICLWFGLVGFIVVYLCGLFGLLGCYCLFWLFVVI